MGEAGSFRAAMGSGSTSGVKRPAGDGFILQTGLAGLPAALTGGAVAIGNFDGVHRGHKVVLAAARAAADSAAGPAVALTFEPHPRSFFRPETPIPRLSPAAEKRVLIAEQGFDGMVELAFDAAMAAVTAEEFVADILAGQLKAKTVVVGWDFHFGKGRGGSPAFLLETAPRYGIEVRVIEPVGGSVPVSSSSIRSLLAEGRMAEANRQLDHVWFVLGAVVHGEKRGRDLGYPTANIELPLETPLAHGIYAVRVEVDGQIYGGVANFGRRPQFHDAAPPLLEPHLFDFSGDLYGKTIGVEFLGRLRGEERFANVEALIAQMDRDSAEARRLIADPASWGAQSLFG